MKVTFQPLSTLAKRASTKSASFSANEAFASETEQEVMVHDTTGFHIYGELHFTRNISAAVDQNKANLYLKLLEDYAQIASEFTEGNGDVMILEIQGERIHFLIEKEVLDKEAIEQLLEFTTYLTNAVYEVIKPKAGNGWAGFSMAADHGRAIILNTGHDGDDSLISLGNPANAPAKRLGKTPKVKSGHIAIKTALLQRAAFPAHHSDLVVEGWTEIELKGRQLPIQKTARTILMEQIIANFSNENARTRNVALFAKAAELRDTSGSTVANPAVVQGFVLRADLDGFTKKVEAAFALANQEPGNRENALRQLVIEFMKIMKLPDEFEKFLGCDFIRLPWAGDCYNVVLFPRNYETFEIARSHLPAVAALRWIDPDGKVNEKRDSELAEVSRCNSWSVAVAGGEESDGGLLIANIPTPSRPFLVVAGWGARRSLDAQNSEGLKANEAVIHDEDYLVLDQPFKEVFHKWKEGPVEYQKATALGLQRAEKHLLIAAISTVQITPRVATAAIPVAAKPYYEQRNIS